MSWTCDPCHQKFYRTKGTEVHWSGSRGACEECKKSALCSDCGCYKRNIFGILCVPTDHEEKNR